MSLDLRPNRKYPNLPSITNDPASHRDALRAVTEALNIGQRRTADILSSFIRVSDLVDLGLIELSGGSFASAPSTYTPSPHTHPLLTEVTGQGALAYLNSLAHVATTGLGADDHTQYILVDGTRAFTGTQTTQGLLPSADITYDIGSLTARYVSLFGTRLRVIGGDAPTTTNYVAPIHQIMTISNAGTLNVDMRAGGQQAIGAGYVKVAASSTGNFTSRSGATVIAGIDAAGGGTATVQCLGSSIVAGKASTTAAATALLGTSLTGVQGALCLGNVSTGYAGINASIQALYSGSFASGNASTSASATADIAARAAGSFAQGAVSNGGLIDASSSGSFAQGYAQDGAVINAFSVGSFAQGASYDEIKADAYGAFAQGYCLPGYRILAQGGGGGGAMAVGYTSTGSIETFADNAQQFGPGVNSEDDTFQVGSAGLRLKGTTGPPGVKQNGDHWMGGTGDAFVIIHSNSQDVQLNVGQAYTVNTYTTDRDLTSSGSVTLAEVADVLATLINDLKTAGHLN